MGKFVTDVGQVKESKAELKKHAAAIHCSNALSLLQRKISNALLYHAYKELMQKEEHEISIKQLCRLIGYQGHNHAAIREALRGLISTVIEWNLINDVTGTENWTASSIIASVSLEGPLCYYAYSPRMKQLLHSPSMFGKIDLVIQSRFRSSYGLALYENCIRYRDLPHTKWFDMELFKKLMGIPPGMYEVFRDFKRRVLDKAIDEVNGYSDLIVESELVREGRKVVRIRFKLKERAKKTRLGSKANANQDLKTILNKEFGLSKSQIEQLLSDYQNEFIEEKIHLIKSAKPYQEGKVKNLSAYLISALKNDYQKPKLIKHEVINLQEAKQELEVNELKKQAESIRVDYLAYREKAIHEFINQLPLIEKENFLKNFYEYAQQSIDIILQLQKRKYKRDNILESPQIKALLRQFALRELDLSDVCSMEEYVMQLHESKRDAWQLLKSFDPDHPLLKFNELEIYSK